MNAYEIAKEIANFTTNKSRKTFVHTLAEEYSQKLQRTLITQHIDVLEHHGDTNFILSSGHKNPFLITAHYDAVILEENSQVTTPGANDNGSGVGAVFESAMQLKNYPIDFVLFGGEEIGCHGAKTYLSKMKTTPRAVLNLDTCGSGGMIGVLIPQEVYIGKSETLHPTTKELNKHYIDYIMKCNYKFCNNDPLATGDHGPFLKAGIPTTTIQGEDLEFYGIVDGKYVKEKMIMHTAKDTIQRVDNFFLEHIVKIVVEGTKNYFSTH